MRPIDSHVKAGSDAYLDGVDIDSCPYSIGLLKNLEWTIGWLQTANSDPLATDLDLAEMEEDNRIRADALRADRRAIFRRIRQSLPGAADIAESIGIPLASWPGQCHAIASALHGSGMLKYLEEKHGKSRVGYGIYRGSILGGPFAGRPFSHHGWIEFDDGLVIDPTRWVFEETPPGLAAAPIDDYDLAGRFTRQTVSPRPLPPTNPEERHFTWDGNDPAATETLRTILDADKNWDRQIGLSRMVWIGNLALDQFGGHARSIYGFFERAGMIALIPVDNRAYVEEAGEEIPSGMSP